MNRRPRTSLYQIFDYSSQCPFQSNMLLITASPDYSNLQVITPEFTISEPRFLADPSSRVQQNHRTRRSAWPAQRRPRHLKSDSSGTKIEVRENQRNQTGIPKSSSTFPLSSASPASSFFSPDPAPAPARPSPQNQLLYSPSTPGPSLYPCPRIAIFLVPFEGANGQQQDWWSFYWYLAQCQEYAEYRGVELVVVDAHSLAARTSHGSGCRPRRA